MAAIGVIAAGLCTPIMLAAGPIVFDHDGVIADGDSYIYVMVVDTPPARTTLNVTGGSVTDLGITAWHSSTVNISGGHVRAVSAYDSSSVRLTGGETLSVTAAQNAFVGASGIELDNLDATGRGRVVFSDGTIRSAVRASDWATIDIRDSAINTGDPLGSVTASGGTVNVYGGAVGGWIQVGGSGVVNLHDAHFNGWLWGTDSGRVNLYASNANLDPQGPLGNPVLTGTWLDGVPFEITLRDMQTLDHITVLPEPAAFLLLAIGACGVFWRRRRALQIK